jgi:hypothetical protein
VSLKPRARTTAHARMGERCTQYDEVRARPKHTWSAGACSRCLPLGLARACSPHTPRAPQLEARALGACVRHDRTNPPSSERRRIAPLKAGSPPCGGLSRGESSQPMRGWPQNPFLDRSLVGASREVKSERQNPSQRKPICFSGISGGRPGPANSYLRLHETGGPQAFHRSPLH